MVYTERDHTSFHKTFSCEANLSFRIQTPSSAASKQQHHVIHDTAFYANLSYTGGFGQSPGSTSLFGQSKPAFGATSSSGTSLFGSTATAGSGGFGGGTSTFGGTTANNSTFGGSNTGGGFSFGQSKPAFGSGGGTGLFGSAGNTAGASGFGTSQSNPFGQAGAGTALGQVVPPCEGTAVTPFNPTNEKDQSNNGTNSFQSINFMPAYSKYSFEVSVPINGLTASDISLGTSPGRLRQG